MSTKSSSEGSAVVLHEVKKAFPLRGGPDLEVLDLQPLALPAGSCTVLWVRRRVAGIVDQALDFPAEINPKPLVPHSFFKFEPFAAAR